MDAEPWCTATLRPVGVLRRGHADLIAETLRALSHSASMVYLDLEVARLSGQRVSGAIGQVASELVGRGGALLVVNVDPTSAEMLARSAPEAVVLAPRAGSGPTSPLTAGDEPAPHPFLRARIRAVLAWGLAAALAGAAVAPSLSGGGPFLPV